MTAPIWMRTTDVATIDALDRMQDVLDRALALVCQKAFISRQPTPETANLAAYEFKVARTVQNALSLALTSMSTAAESVDCLLAEMEQLIERNPERPA